MRLLCRFAGTVSRRAGRSGAIRMTLRSETGQSVRRSGS